MTHGFFEICEKTHSGAMIVEQKLSNTMIGMSFKQFSDKE